MKRSAIDCSIQLSYFYMIPLRNRRKLSVELSKYVNIMVSLRAVVLAKKKLATGKHRVRIAIAHNGGTRYLLTNIMLDSINEFKNGMVVNRPDASSKNIKIRKLLEQYQDAIENINYINGITCSELVSIIQNEREKKHRTLKSVFEEYIKIIDVKKGSLEAYTSRYKSIAKFFGGNCLMETINHASILKFHKYEIKNGAAANTIRCRFTFLKMLYRYALRYMYIPQRMDPFIGLKLPAAEIRQS